MQLSEWQRHIQERQGLTVDEWCMSMGISKGAYYHSLRKVREYMCRKMGVMEGSSPREMAQSTAVVPILTAQSREEATIEMQLGELQIRFNEKPDAGQLKVTLAALVSANKPLC